MKIKKAYCDIYKRVVAECEHYLAKGDTRECKKAIQQLRAYEKELNGRRAPRQTTNSGGGGASAPLQG